jgi:polysaccharide deacetylase family protein (PEP-CTERM system associated)
MYSEQSGGVGGSTEKGSSHRFTNAMSVDVEDYFQVSAFESHISRVDWERLPRRVDGNTRRVLELFEAYGAKATFFVLGWVAKRCPDVVRAIVEQGHELASHGWSHVRVTQQDPKSFRRDVERSKKLLEDLGGVAVLGYRAASYSIGRENLWALRELEAAGYGYSSSIYPIRHDLYGMPEAPRFAFHPHGEGGILEVPVTTVELGRRKLPCGGGGYFRLFPYALSRAFLQRVNYRDRRAAVFYFHPWEIDPEQPRQSGIGVKTRFRHYLNLQRMEPRLGRLLNDFHWDRMDRVFLDRG